jgi:hypothetical protein
MKWLVFVLLATPAYAETATSTGGMLRWLDKVSGDTEDLELPVGQSVQRGHLIIQMDECRYPANDPASDAFAHLTVMDERETAPVFVGWMIATSPALSAMDHPRYDVWVLNCITPKTDQPVLEEDDADEEPASE